MTTRHRWRRDASAAGGLLFLLTALVQVAPAQSLGDVARREAERRAQVTAWRAYTNADLASVDAPAPVPVDAVTRSGAATPDTPVPGEETEPANNSGIEPIVVQALEKRDERYWRATARDLRERLAAVIANVAAKNARLREIDAGPRTPTTAREREVIAGTVDRLQRDARFHNEDLTRFLTRARTAKVPEEWIR